MTDDEKRKQKAMLLLQHEETRQELEHLRTKAWTLGEEVKEIARWLDTARGQESGYRDVELVEKIDAHLPHYRKVFDFDAIASLRDELKRTHDKLRELTTQKKALGLGE